MCMTLGGRVSEEIFFGRITTGARDDLQKVQLDLIPNVLITNDLFNMGIILITDNGKCLRSDRTVRYERKGRKC